MMYRFQVGLSFSSQYRPFVKEVAEQLVNKLGKEKVFYDKNYVGELASRDLDIQLQNIYGHQCELIVIFTCKSYGEKQWCRLEWAAIRNLMLTKYQESQLAIMQIRMEDCKIPGLPETFGYVDASDESEAKIASLIIERLDSNKTTQNSPAKVASSSEIPVTDSKPSKVRADSSEQSYKLLEPCEFDLNQLIENSLDLLCPKKPGLVGLVIPCNDSVFGDEFCKRLKNELVKIGRSNITIKPSLRLNRILFATPKQAVEKIKKYKNEVQKRDIICHIQVDVGKKDKSYSDEFWQEMCIAFPSSFKHTLIIIMVGSEDKIFPKDVNKLEPPQFKEVHVRRWVRTMHTRLGWEEDIIAKWEDLMIADCTHHNYKSEQMDIRSVYDHLYYSQEILQPNLSAEAFLEELKQRIDGYV